MRRDVTGTVTAQSAAQCLMVRFNVNLPDTPQALRLMFDLVLKDLIFHQQLTPVSLWHEDRLKGRGGGVAVGGGGANDQPESSTQHKQR